MLRRYLSFAVLALGCQGKSEPAPTPVKPVSEPAVKTPAAEAPPPPKVDDGLAPIGAAAIADAKAKAIAKHGEANKAAIERGVDQVASLWRTSDGDLAAFVVEQFVADASLRDRLFTRLGETLEQIKGHNLEVVRFAKWGAEVEDGKPVPPSDNLLASYDPTAHVVDDLFRTKVAFVALLNFPLTTLADRIKSGASWDRRTWAEARLTGWFDTRIPGDVQAAASAAEAAADQYIAGYNIWMHHVLGKGGERLFPSGKRLISHWNLRDELKANYAEKEAGLAKQQTIAMVMNRIVTQTIPAAVIDNPHLDWNPFTNEVKAAEAGTVEADAPKERPAVPRRGRPTRCASKTFASRR